MPYKIREYREKAHLTQDELSKRSNVSRATISALENGRASITTTGTLSKLAEALGCKVSNLILP